MSREMKDSGVEWVGAIPENWDIKRCKYNFAYHKNIAGVNSINYERLALTMRGVVKRAKEDADGLQPENFDGYQIANEGDLIFKLIDLAGKSTSRVGLSPYTGLVSPAYILLHANDEKMNKEYAQYFFLSMWYRLIFNQIGNGGIRSSLNATDLLEVPITTPKLTEQQQIVHFLDRKCTAIDTAIEKTKKSIEKLEEYKKAVITKAVTKGIDPNAKMKDSGVEWIGDIPEDWKVTKTKYLFRILKRIAGQEGFDVISITQKGLKIKDITSNEGQVAENYSNYQFVFPGDFAMNHMDLLTGWVDLSTLTGVTSPDYRVFHKINESVNDDYYKYVFQSLYFNKVYYGLAQGVAEVGRKRLQAPAFKELKLPCPPSDKPAKIAAYIKDKCMAIDALIEKKQTAINKWEEYKKSLIYYAVTGKIDCRNEVIE